MRLQAVVAVLACILTTSTSPGTAQQPDRFATAWERAASELRGELETAGVVGGSYWFLHGAKVLGREFHGFADLATKRKVDADTIFHWASVTKTLTGIVTMQLRERAKLGLDDKIVDQIPALRQVHSGEWDVSAVTVRHLLSHSGGFRENSWPWGGETWQPYEPATWEQLAAMFPYTRLRFAPGAMYSYSNPGYIFVGRLIEQVTGEDFEVHVDKNVLKPLGMHRSFFDATPYHLLKHRSNNYHVVDGSYRANGLDLDTGITTSNGGLNAPIPDMIRYVRFLLGAGDLQRFEEVLPRWTLESMWNPEQKAGKEGSYDRSMGLSFFVYEKRGVRVIGHTGSQRGFQCFILFDPSAQTAAIAAFNSFAKHPDPKLATRAIMLRFMATVLERLMPIFRGAR